MLDFGVAVEGRAEGGLDAVDGVRAGHVGDRRTPGVVGLKPHHLHQPRHHATSDVEALPPELAPDLSDPVDLKVLLPDPSDFGDRLGVPARPGLALEGSRRVATWAWYVDGRSAGPCGSARPRRQRDNRR